MNEAEQQKYEPLIEEAMRCVREQGVVGRKTSIAYPEYIEDGLKEAIPRTGIQVPEKDLEPLVMEIARRVQEIIPLPKGSGFAERVRQRVKELEKKEKGSKDS